MTAATGDMTATSAADGHATVEIRDLVKHYRTRGRGTVHALDGVSLSVGTGETLGLVGESGCGKSTLARLLVQLEEPTSGTILVDGRDITTASRRERRRLRRTVQMVFQDPFASLNPRLRVGGVLTEVLAVHHLGSGASDRREQAETLLRTVGLPAGVAAQFPHQLSGGQRQRVGIARALAVRPRVLVLDEALSALDVSVRAEIMNLLARLRRELGLTYVFISHDLGMVRHISDRIAVMYLGEIVELGAWRAVSDEPAHPYAAGLQGAVPTTDPELEAGRGRTTVRGEVPDAARPPSGCRFHPRCPLAEQVCRERVPELSSYRSTDEAHLVSCHVVKREAVPATSLLHRDAGGVRDGPRR